MAPNSMIDSKLFKFKSNLNHLINLLDIGSVVLYPPESGFNKTDHHVFPHKIGVFSFGRWFIILSVVGGWRPVVGYAYGLWSVVFMVGAIGGRCFMFLMVGGRLFFRQWSVVGVLSSIWSVVGGTRSVVGGLWSVAGRWFCTTPCLTGCDLEMAPYLKKPW